MFRSLFPMFLPAERYSCALIAVLLLIPCHVFSKENHLPDATALLRSVRSPMDLLLPYLPRSYSAPVLVEGPPADEMRRMCEKLNLPPPRYNEVFDKNHRFFLYLTNPDYPLETRECLTGIFNPVEMIDLIIASALKYRDEGMFSLIVKETAGTVSEAAVEGKRAYRVQLRPTGACFGYSYQDMGAFTRESWLTGISAIMDSASRLVREMTLHKCWRQFEGAGVEKPPVDSVVTRYSFSYGECGGVLLPTGVRLWVNGALTLTLSATYRRLENTYRVFDTREICTPRSGADSCLALRYGEYRIGDVPDAVKSPVKPATYQKNLERAARLSQEAAAALHNGDIETSVRACKKIVAQYPETPQAVEARRLLSGLPMGK